VKPGNCSSRSAALLTFASAWLLAGCNAQESFTNPHGPSAGLINAQWWTMLSVFGLAWLVTMFIVWFAVFKTDRTRRSLTYRHARNLVAAGGFIVPISVFFMLLIASVYIGSKTEAAPPPNALNLMVVGRQWWWEVRYLKPDNSIDFVTADEIHIPVGRPVLVKLQSGDVIHSFWVPALQNKTDAFPGRVTENVIQASDPGVYPGQCYEFCGMEHAHMGFLVIAQSQDDYNGWAAHARSPAVAVTDPVALRGERVFESAPCVICHTIDGTNAHGLIGPNLTHFGSRHTIAARTLPNTLGNLAGWISDPQGIKPGTRMASVAIDPGDMQPLLTYLESLK
jgi:cytochrome c oxidase subunit II